MQRFWEVDFARGLAIIKMIISNYILDIMLFTTINLGSFALLAAVPIAAVMFMFLMGISLSLSCSRAKLRGIYTRKKYFKRGAKIFFIGLAITAITFSLFPTRAIYFGVLHFAGVAILISPLFLRFHRLNAVLGAIIIIAGVFINALRFDFSYLLWLGFAPTGFQTLDYFPILPWLGVVLAGMFCGQILYRNGKRIFKIREMPPAAGPVCLLGRHSLLIYAVHQVVFVGLLLLLGIAAF